MCLQDKAVLLPTVHHLIHLTVEVYCFGVAEVDGQNNVINKI